MSRNKADMIVANDYKDISDKLHIAYLINNNRIVKPLKKKREIAEGIVSHLGTVFGGKW